MHAVHGKQGVNGETADIVIAGGAVMGSSIACHLAAHPRFSGRIIVIEPDMSYARAASALSAGSIRQQFSQSVNIEISLYGIAFLREIDERLVVGEDRPAIGLTEGGYLYLGGETASAGFALNNAIQRSKGADIALLDQAGLAAEFPWLNTEDLAIGSYGRTGEGWFDGYSLMQAFRNKARSLGVVYQKGRVAAFEKSAATIKAVILEDGTRISCGVFVNTAGASGARDLCEKAGYPVPVFAKKRCVFSFLARDTLHRHPLIIDPTGVWWRPEGEGYIAGYSPDNLDESDHGADFEVDWDLFGEILWPTLAHRVPHFEAIKPRQAWAGHYDMNLLDHNAIIGRLGALENAYLATGFSGHGLQQAPAVGRGLAELIIDERYTSLDLSDLSFERIIAGKPLKENNVI